MRLINAKTLELEEFGNDQAPQYAILSHTWEGKEVSYEDMQAIGKPTRTRGFKKIRFACKQALYDGQKYVWIDTCCIDKKSSAELQEAINSMYRYYAEAEICYVYLAELDEECPVLHDGAPAEYLKLHSWREQFMQCRWFGRGWSKSCHQSLFL